MKKITSLLLALVMALGLAACAVQPRQEDYQSVNIRLGGLKGPTSMGMAKLLDDAENGLTANTYEFTMAASASELTPKLIQGELDILAVPANVGAILYNQTQGQVELVAASTLGVLYIVENGSTVASVQDLRGRTIFASGKGATPEYALNYILRGNGLNPEKDVTIEWKSEHSECLAALVSTPGSVAMLPQPFVTTAQMKQEGVQIVLDMNREWERLADSSRLITGVVVARAEYISQHPEEVSAFLDAYKASVAFVNENNDEAAALIGQFDIIPEAVAQKALPYCRIVYIDGQEMQTQLSGYLKVLFDQNPAAVGGALPDEAFYYQR